MIRQFDTVDVPPGADLCGVGGTPPCSLEAGHHGDHAEVSFSGLVISTWPVRQRHYYDFDDLPEDQENSHGA